MSESKLLSWKSREEDLKKIKRYGKFDVMFYRTNDLVHSKRVMSLVKKVSPFVKSLYPNFDVLKAELIANHHDDHEIVLKGGDISLQLKLMMSEKELSSLQRDELSAVDMLSDCYPKRIKGYAYQQLLYHAVFKDCIESQLVSFVDKIDGYNEALHEVLAGNIIFLEPIINYNLKTFNNLSQKYPLIKDIFESKHELFSFPVIDLKEYFFNGNIGSSSHTLESLKRKVAIPNYELWKKVSIKTFGVEILTNQLEFHPLQTNN